MASMVFKLYRDPDDAAAALTNLKSSGFNAPDIGVVVSAKVQPGQLSKAVKDISGSKCNVGDVVVMGALAESVKGDGVAEALIQALSINEEKGKYFEQALFLGGVLVAVKTDETKVAKARDILRKAESMPERHVTKMVSPGFYEASRMAATNPIDAPMSGDFRKY